jgi:DNA-binding MarR family transcriptional regulator
MQQSLFDVLNEPVETITPYAGTSGWSGSTTSKERAERQDKDGTTSKRQQAVLIALAELREKGATWIELGNLLGLHHGSISGVLSNLHREGLLCRLKARRNRCQIYILPQFVGDSELEPFRPNVSTRLLAEILAELETDLAKGAVALARHRIALTLKSLTSENK